MNHPSNNQRRHSACLVLASAIASVSALSGQEAEVAGFESSPAFFQVVSGQLNSLDPNNGGYTAIGAKQSSYNAAGYNVLDKCAYAWGRYAPFRDQLIRIYGDGSIKALGTPEAIGASALTFNIYAGDMDLEGNLWVRGDRFNAPDLMKIDVETNTYEMVRFSGVNPGSVADLVYMERDGRGYFYGTRNQDLYVWDVEAKTTVKVAVSNMPEGKVSYGAAYTDSDASLFVSSNKGGVYRILDYDTQSPRAVYLLDSVQTGNNDGFSCPDVAAPIIVPANQAPTVSIPENVVVSIDAMKLVLAPNVTDEGLPFDGGGLQIKWTQEAGPSECRILQPTSPKCEFRFPKRGEYTLRCNATDGEYETYQELFVTVGEETIEGVGTEAPVTDEYRNAREIWKQVKEQLHCRRNGTVLEEEKRGFDKDEFTLKSDAEVIVTVIYDGADARNTLGWYDAAISKEHRNIWFDFATGPNAPLQVGSKASLGVLPAGTELRFCLVQDGARGGENMLFQDSELNPGGFEHVAARLFTDIVEDRPMVIGFEDREYGGDLDYNDVIFQIEIIEQSLGSTQYDDVIAGQAGLNCDRGSRGVHQTLGKVGMQGADYEIVSQLFEMPSEKVLLEMIDDRSSMKFDLCAFDYDQVKHLHPSSLAFRTHAAEIAISVLDDRKANPGQAVWFDPIAAGLAGKTVGFMFVPNNTRTTFLRNPWRYTAKGQGERTKRQPLFSLNSANPGALDQLLTFQSENLTVFAMEDHTRFEEAAAPEAGDVSDSNFDDAMIVISPRLVPVDIFATEFYQASEDTTYGYDFADGHAERVKANCY